MTADNDQVESAPPLPSAELKRLKPLLGTWKAEDNTHDSVLGPGERVTSTETFSWLDGGYFPSARTKRRSGTSRPSAA
jgi:hypothetical protein